MDHAKPYRLSSNCYSDYNIGIYCRVRSGVLRRSFRFIYAPLNAVTISFPITNPSTVPGALIHHKLSSYNRQTTPSEWFAERLRLLKETLKTARLKAHPQRIFLTYVKIGRVIQRSVLPNFNSVCLRMPVYSASTGV